MNSASPPTTLNVRDLQAMSAKTSGPRKPNAKPEISPSADSLTIPAHLQAWLFNAALGAEIEKSAAQVFAETGLVTMGTTQIVLFSRDIGPATEWWLMGYLQPPSFLTPQQWHQMLLWGNAVAPALDHCSLALDEQGASVASLRIPFHLQGDVQALSGALAVLGCLTDSLVVALNQPLSSEPSTLGTIDGAPPLDANGQRFREQLKQSTDRGAAQALKHQWHQALIDGALKVLGIPHDQPVSTVSTVSTLKLVGRTVEIMADGDGRSLVLSTQIDRPLRTAAQCKEALRMNLHLMTLAGTSLALDPKGARALMRWDATGLDGQALADTLMSFVMLALSLQTAPSQNAPTTLNARSFT